MSAEPAKTAVQTPVCKFAEGCHRVVACDPGCGSPPDGTLLADAVLAGRAVSSGMFLAGLIANGELATVGSPGKLPQYLYPDVPAERVQEIFQHGVAVGLHAARESESRYRDEMSRIAAALSEAGFRAMGRLVSRSRRLVAPELTHPADGESGPERPSAV